LHIPPIFYSPPFSQKPEQKHKDYSILFCYRHLLFLPPFLSFSYCVCSVLYCKLLHPYSTLLPYSFRFFKINRSPIPIHIKFAPFGVHCTYTFALN
jgi:hypothetical protein